MFVSGLLFFSLLVNAQDENKKEVPVYDTAVDMDTPLPPEEETSAVVQEGKNNYFYNTNDTLVLQKRSVPNGVIKKWVDDKDFWYANAALKKKKSKEQVVPEQENGQKGQKGKGEQGIKEQKERERRTDDSTVPIGQRSWVQTLLWIVIIAGFAAFLYIYLSGSSIGLFRKRNVKVTTAQEDDVLTEDIFAINYQKEIDKAAAQGNHRLAIRLLFLRLLKNMTERNIIRYKQDKTNLDYLLELQSTTYYQHFFRITRNYEYSWYGKFPVSEEAYKIIRSDFEEFDKVLR